MSDLSHIKRPHRANQPAWQAIKRLCSEQGQVRLDHLHLLRRLGAGDVGNVFLCEIKHTMMNFDRYGGRGGGGGCYYALKVVDRECLRMKDKLKRAEVERQVLSVLDHPFLPTLYADFDAYHYSCLLIDYCHGGDLFRLQQNQPCLRFSLSTAKFYAAEVLLALEYLHMMGIIYRDLKPENVLIQEDGHVMLSDFDLSLLHCEAHPKLLKGRLEHDKTATTKKKKKKKKKSASFCCENSVEGGVIIRRRRRKKKNKAYSCTVDDVEVSAEPMNARSNSFVGTHEYLAPEMILGLGHGSAVDWWAYGVFLYELLYGITPFKDKDNEKTMRNIIGKSSVRFPTSDRFRDDDEEEMGKAQDLIRKLLVKNPKKRLGSMRGSCEIKRHEFFGGTNWALIRSNKPPIVPKEESNNDVSVLSDLARQKATVQTSQKLDFF